MITPAEEAWVRQQLSVGVPEQTLRTFLQQKAHTVTEINDLFVRVRSPNQPLSLIEKIKLSMFEPMRFFSIIGQTEKTYGPVIGYYFFMVLVNSAIYTILALLFLNALLALLPPIPQLAILGTMQWLVFVILFGFSLLMFPLLFLVIGVVHLYYKIFGAQGTYLNTLQLGLYASTPLIVLQFIPILGLSIGSIWQLVIYICGLKQLHGFSTLKALVAMFIIPIVLITLLGLAVGFYGGMFAKTTAQFAPV